MAWGLLQLVAKGQRPQRAPERSNLGIFASLKHCNQTEKTCLVGRVKNQKQTSGKNREIGARALTWALPIKM